MILIRFYKLEYKIEINGVLIFIHLKRRLLYNNLKKNTYQGKEYIQDNKLLPIITFSFRPN